MRVFSRTSAGFIDLSLTLRDNGEFLIKESAGPGPDALSTEYEGHYELDDQRCSLGCQFKIETRVGRGEDEATAVRRRCRDVFTAVVGATSANLHWNQRSVVLDAV
jgi:hypothetical protein